MKQRIVNYILRNHLNATTIDDVITQDDKHRILLGGKPITENDLRQLQAEVKALESSKMWSILTNSLRHSAQDKIFNKSLDFQDVMYGKAMLYNIGLQESIVRLIRNKK